MTHIALFALYLSEVQPAWPEREKRKCHLYFTIFNFQKDFFFPHKMHAMKNLLKPLILSGLAFENRFLDKQMKKT